MKYTKSSPIAAIRAAGQADSTDTTAADWDRIAAEQTAGQTTATSEDWARALDANDTRGGQNTSPGTGQFDLQQTNRPQQPGFSMTGAQVASIINGVLGGTVTLATAQINSDRARDIAETNAATMQAIARIQADLASNPNSAQSAVLQSQLQALTAFAQQRDLFREQQQQWLKYALLGVVGLVVVGGGAYVLVSRGGHQSASHGKRRRH